MKIGHWILGGAVVGLAAFGGVLAALHIDRQRGAGDLAQILGSDPTPALTVQAPAGRPAFDFAAAARRVLPSVVSVDNIRSGRTLFGESMTARQGSGSGVIISRDGYILTNNHVVQGASFLRVRLSDGRMLPGRLVGRDPRSDLALLKVDATGLTAAEFGDSQALQQGQWVMAVGSPLGYDNTVSVGVVSSTGRTLPTEGTILVDTIQTDAAINQGNSGGALTTADGRLVGINTAIASIDGGSIGIGFSIPIHRAKQIVDDFLKHGRARYGALGLRTDPREWLLQDDEMRARLREATGSSANPPRRGLLISRVTPGSPAARAGIRDLDVLIELDGKALTDRMDYDTIMLSRRPGQSVRLRWWSRGETKTATVSLAEAG
ncbi:MAG: trypsin-like peptidase domain-containing protein [Fimbriimonadaceae bacterium]|nr:trypsin-like peptidase domain-containing protein [Fimbriimonadaceae bacterium]